LAALVMKQLWDTYEDFAKKLEQVALPAQWIALAVFESGALYVLRLKMALPQIRQTQRWP
jgi:hypothetical protein